jgi:hypothetical protein
VIEKAPERPVFLVVVKGIRWEQAGRRRARRPAYLLVSAVSGEDGGRELPYAAEELLSWAWQRWEVEVCHREMMRWGAWSYGVMVLAGLRAWGLGVGPACVRPAGRWWGGSGRWSMGTLWRGYRSELWGPSGCRLSAFQLVTFVRPGHLALAGGRTSEGCAPDLG